MSTPILLDYGDIGTVVASAVESYLYRSSVDWMSCSKQGLLGIVSRYVQYYVVGFMPVLTKSFTENQKSAFVVFVVSAVYHRLMEKKKSSLLAGFRTAQADTVGSEMVTFFGMSPLTPIIGPLGGEGTSAAGTSFFSNPFASNTIPVP